jgi:nucleoside-diphosphate-sugar epimerase
MAEVSRIVYLSSAEVYGQPETNPVSEHHRLQARSPYAASKIAAESLIEAYVASGSLAAVILRPFSIYGPNPTSDSLFGTILSMAKNGRVLLRDLTPVRDYCYVADLAMAVVRACSLKNHRLQVINIGTGAGTSVAEFAACVLQSLGLQIPVIEARPGPRQRQSEIFELIADIAVARDVLGWRPKTNLGDGLRLAVELGSMQQ